MIGYACGIAIAAVFVPVYVNVIVGFVKSLRDSYRLWRRGRVTEAAVLAVGRKDEEAQSVTATVRSTT